MYQNVVTIRNIKLLCTYFTTDNVGVYIQQLYPCTNYKTRSITNILFLYLEMESSFIKHLLLLLIKIVSSTWEASINLLCILDNQTSFHENSFVFELPILFK